MLIHAILNFRHLSEKLTSLKICIDSLKSNKNSNKPLYKTVKICNKYSIYTVHGNILKKYQRFFTLLKTNSVLLSQFLEETFYQKIFHYKNTADHRCFGSRKLHCLFLVTALYFMLFIYYTIKHFRYYSIAEAVRKEEKEVGARKVEVLLPDWSFNIGEPILGMDSVTLSSFENGIIVLGERTLYCLGDGCTSIKFAKRLEYGALCFFPYVIGKARLILQGIKIEKSRKLALLILRIPIKKNSLIINCNRNVMQGGT